MTELYFPYLFKINGWSLHLTSLKEVNVKGLNETLLFFLQREATLTLTPIIPRMNFQIRNLNFELKSLFLQHKYSF
jgi:hypothetical protein